MILLIAEKYRRRVAFLLLLVADLSFMQLASAHERLGIVLPAAYVSSGRALSAISGRSADVSANLSAEPIFVGRPTVTTIPHRSVMTAGTRGPALPARKQGPEAAPPRLAAVTHQHIGGPNQPEMTSFKSVNAKDLVNLFTGDFNYNIPLIDVGGYPINLYYTGGVGVEQEASWVGLGWNLNPGTITRNMRGIPDDFNGQDTLIQTQNTKPNNTWGITTDADIEGIGIKFLPASLGLSAGISFNNYLGPALDLGIKGETGLSVANVVGSEKNPISLGGNASISADLNSRNGLTLSPSVSLTASMFANDAKFSVGAGISTSYNSRVGIKALQISEQVHANTYSGTPPSLGQMALDYFNGIPTQHSSTISFARPSYTPTLRMPLSNNAISGHFQLGGGISGVYVSGEIEAFAQTSAIEASRIVQKKPMVGYLYYEQGMNNPNAVMDFTRFNDREVTPNTPIISAPQYTYDVFTIQGEGTGGTIRAFRNDPGFVRDNTTTSQDNSGGFGVDIGIPGHYGGNFNEIKTPTSVGEWTAGNELHAAMPFKGPSADTGNLEHVYFRNPGEANVMDNGAFTYIGGIDLVRYELAGDGHNPRVQPMLDRFSTGGTFIASVNPVTTHNPLTRKKRSQLIDMLTADQATLVGLDKRIRSYSSSILDPNTDTLLYTSMARDTLYKQGHHISQINVTEPNGKRYVYGIPVYNTKQQDFTFTVNPGETSLATPGTTDQVSYNQVDLDPLNNPAVKPTKGTRDGYVQITQTPAYAHSFLLTALLSPDYVDVTGDGITDDDLGEAIKFNYTQIAGSHHWRTPIGFDLANFNAGNRSNVKDDKGLFSYGERESWYLHSIESKTMIAVFILANRLDAKGVNDVNGQVNGSDNTSQCLQEIRLYSKSDLKQHGLTGSSPAKPIKSVHFSYSYTLCQGTPDNTSGTGKLTLDSIWFTYNNQTRANLDKYAFSYVDSAGGGNETLFGNPNYTVGASDRWGTYKSATMNPGQVRNSDFPYTPQNQLGSASPKPSLDTNASAWSLKRILLPSGGQIEVGYESDDYAYVQNKRAMDMLTVAGFGNSPAGYSNRLFDIVGSTIVENNYLFVNVPVAIHSTSDIANFYLQGVNQIAVKLAVNMPAGMELLTSYANISSYGMLDTSHIWLQLTPVNGVSPLSLTAVEFLREQLPAEAYPGYDVSSGSGLEEIADALVGMLDGLKSAFSDPVKYLRTHGMAQTVQLSECFARLNDPDGFKYGGGHRVKFVSLKDNWKPMTGQFTSVYTHTYDYTTTETFNGTTRTISSGVASYEPGIGGDENPFQTIVQVANSLPLGPTSYGAIEMPVLEPFFPAPVVGYSQVTVRSVSSAPPQAGQKSNSGIGRQVTEFYTAKDYPVYYSNTGLDPSTDYEAHDNSSTNFFSKYAFDGRALSQGFLVAVNDMHGKMKAQSSYADNDTTLRVNYTQNFYRNTGVNGLNELFSFVSAAQGGVITQGNLGIDVELMTDTRQFLVQSNSQEYQGQVEMFPFIPPLWLPFIWPVYGNSYNNYRAVTTTKVVSYHSVLDSVVTYDKGSVVSTKNLVYDAETGEVLVTRTNNQFNQSAFSTSYPAWWAYSGMGPAYRNDDITFSGLNFSNGALTAGQMNPAYMESGDEYIVTAVQGFNSCPQPSPLLTRLWLLDLNKNLPPFPVPSGHNYLFIDSAGDLYTNNTPVTLHIIRSGKRNMLDVKLATVLSMVSPIVTNGSTQTLSIGSASKVIRATAGDYNEKWQNDIDAFPLFALVNNPSTCVSTLVQECTGTLLEKAINPYRKGMLGDFRPYRTLAFYGNRADTITQATNLPQNGFIENFGPYWSFNPSNQLVPNTTNANWLETNRITLYNAKGLELETRNALNIYTAAQYGYGKQMPVATVQNAAQGQAFDEGFEDYGYAATIDPSTALTCSRRYIDLSGFGSIVNPADSLGFGAHTGSYALQVAPGVQATGTLPVAPTFLKNNYTFFLKPDTTKVLNNPGGNITSIYVFPTVGPFSGPARQDTAIESNMQFGSGSSLTLGTLIQDTAEYNANGNSTHMEHDFQMTTSQWMQITTAGNYTVTQSVQDGSSGGVGNTAMSLTITDANGNFVASPTGPNALGGTGAQTGAAVFLCPGYYQVSTTLNNEWSLDEAGDDPPGGGESYLWKYTINSTSPTYKTLSTQNGCIFSDPIAATDTMMNPVFTLTPGTKVEVSAWVHEVCGSTPCTQTTFTNDHIGFTFPGSSILPSVKMHPSGPIIEGWQRIDTAFTVPSDATSGNLILGNDGSQKVYFDDIRVHPFNADMTSYIYDPVSLRLMAQRDANNYATFFEYDGEGTLIRKKAETQQGIQTIEEMRSAKQKNITNLQQ